MRRYPQKKCLASCGEDSVLLLPTFVTSSFSDTSYPSINIFKQQRTFFLLFLSLWRKKGNPAGAVSGEKWPALWTSPIICLCSYNLLFTLSKFSLFKNHLPLNYRKIVSPRAEVKGSWPESINNYKALKPSTRRHWGHITCSGLKAHGASLWTVRKGHIFSSLELMVPVTSTAERVFLCRNKNIWMFGGTCLFSLWCGCIRDCPAATEAASRWGLSADLSVVSSSIIGFLEASVSSFVNYKYTCYVFF